jgi:PKHD-type hydroxylase
MMLHIPEVFSAVDVRALRARVDAGPWLDGRATAGEQGALRKRNLQLDVASEVAQLASQEVLQRVQSHPLFFSAALPLRILAPLFNRYEGGGEYGEHVDGAVMSQRGTAQRLRSDVSATLFLCEPDEYDGGELIVRDTYGEHEVKLPAGDLVVYSSGSLHRVQPVTRGVRTCAFFWVQSMVRDDSRRTLLHEMDRTIQSLRARLGEAPECVALAAQYHNLLRMWAEV